MIAFNFKDWKKQPKHYRSLYARHWNSINCLLSVEQLMPSVSKSHENLKKQTLSPTYLRENLERDIEKVSPRVLLNRLLLSTREFFIREIATREGEESTGILTGRKRKCVTDRWEIVGVPSVRRLHKRVTNERMVEGSIGIDSFARGRRKR